MADQSESNKIICFFVCLGISNPFAVGMSLLFALDFLLLTLILSYGTVMIIFRYAFGVELWSPFG